jgi:hypothetical protein
MGEGRSRWRPWGRSPATSRRGGGHSMESSGGAGDGSRENARRDRGRGALIKEMKVPSVGPYVGGDGCALRAD